MSRMADLITTVVEPMAEVTSAYCGTDWEDVYEGYFEWFCSGCDKLEFEWEADQCIMDAIELDMTDAQLLALKRGVLLGSAIIAGDVDAMELAEAATLVA